MSNFKMKYILTIRKHNRFIKQVFSGLVISLPSYLIFVNFSVNLENHDKDSPLCKQQIISLQESSVKVLKTYIQKPFILHELSFTDSLSFSLIFQIWDNEKNLLNF